MKKLLLSFNPAKRLFLCAMWLLLNLPGMKTYAQSYVFEKEIPVTGRPYGIKIDNAQNVYVSAGNYPLYNIQKYDASGALVQTVGSTIVVRTYQQVVRNPVSGNVAVTETNNDQVVLFDATGARTGSFGSTGAAAGNFDDPAGIAVDASGNYYVVDKNNNRVQKFSQAGAYISSFGASGTGNGQFASPVGICLDASDNIYVVDKGNNRVQKFDNAGNFLLSIGSSGTGDGQFNNPYGVWVDAAGKIYVTDQSNNRVQVFTSAGAFSFKFGTAGAGDGQFNLPSGISVDASGNIFVVDYSNRRVEKFSSTGVFISKFGSLVFGSGFGFWNPSGMSLDAGSGVLYIVDQGNAYVKKVNSTNNAFISAFGYPNSEPGVIDQNASVTVDASGNIFVADGTNYRVQKFDATGAYIKQFGTSSTFSTLVDIAVDASNNIFTCDVTGGHAVRKFTNDGVYVSTPTGLNNYYNARTVYVDNLGQIYTILDNVIYKLSSTGTFILSFGGTGTTDNTFTNAFRLAVDNAGQIYVSDATTNQVKVFNSSGVFITKFGSTGTAAGQTRGAFDIDVAPDGSRVYYVDNFTGFNKVVVYKLNTVLPVVFTSVQGSKLTNGNKIHWDVATEENIRRYKVERSADGRVFSEIGSVIPTNNSNGNASYDFTDQTATGGTWFYRISAEEFNGNDRMSSVIKINATAKSLFGIFPVPATSGEINLQMENIPGGDFKIIVSDMNGSMLFTKQLSHRGTASVYKLSLPGNISSGSYIVSVSDGQHIYQQKILVQK